MKVPHFVLPPELHDRNRHASEPDKTWPRLYRATLGAALSCAMNLSSKRGGVGVSVRVNPIGTLGPYLVHMVRDPQYMGTTIATVYGVSGREAVLVERALFAWAAPHTSTDTGGSLDE